MNRIFATSLVLALAVTLLSCLVRADDEGAVVRVKTRKLSSTSNLPYDFYSLKFCEPQERRSSVESLSEALFGDRIQNSIFNFKFMREVNCKRIETSSLDIHGQPTNNPVNKISCPPALKSEDVNAFIAKIVDDYEVQLLVDNLPVATRQLFRDCGAMPKPSSDKVPYSRPNGFPIGCMTSDKRYFLNNHWTFTIKYHRDLQKDAIYIVGADVVPSSIDYTLSNFNCTDDTPLPTSVPFGHRLEIRPDTPLQSITWSYSLKWEESSIKWASRWDAYSNLSDNGQNAIHWFTIINAVVIVLLLTSMIAWILVRVVGRDIKRYDENEDDESGWKLLHGDVFRPPFAAGLLSVLYGNGIQLLSMTVITLTFALLGMNHPENRGYLGTVMLIMFALMGILGGYQALSFYKMNNGTAWKSVTVATALLFPSLILFIFSFGNLFMKIVADSSSAVPFFTVLYIFTVWSFISVPLVFVGGYFGYTQEKTLPPTEVNSIPRYIPDQPWYLSSLAVFLIAGLLPFGAGVMEVYFVMSTIWLHKFYYVFGFLFLVFFIVLLTCAEVTVVITYFQLCHENYKWWWRSFFLGGSCAFYLFVYSVFYFVTRIQGSFMHTLLYFEYMSIISWLVFLVTGSVGLFASNLFLRKIYSKIKVT